MWVLIAVAVAGYTVDDVVLASRGGLSAEAIEGAARQACPCELTSYDVVKLLRAGVATGIVEIMTGRPLTAAELAEASSPGPTWVVAAQVVPAPVPAPRPIDWDAPPPAPRLGPRAGATLTGVGATLMLLGGATSIGLTVAKPGTATAPLSVVANIAVMAGISWTSAGIIVTALTPPPPDR